MGILDFHVKTPLHNEGGLLMAELFSEPEQLKRIDIRTVIQPFGYLFFGNDALCFGK